MRWKTAEELAAASRWADAGEAFAALAAAAQRRGDPARAGQAASRAADCFRRDDRPARAAAMLRLAIGPDACVVDRVQLAAVLQDAGQVEAALDIVGGRAAADPPSEALRLDTLVGIALCSARVDEARAHLEVLGSLGLAGAEIARRFRQAQLDRLDGLLVRAEEGFLAVIAAIGAHPAGVGPVAAAWGEVGELRSLCLALGRPADPRPALQAALDGWARAGRRAGLFRAEGWLLRHAERPVLTTALDRAIAYAEERGLALAEADLRVSRGVARGDAGDAERAVRLCAEAPLARGRARVIQAELGGAADFEAAFAELRDDAPWTARALLAHPDEGLRSEGRLRVAVMSLP